MKPRRAYVFTSSLAQHITGLINEKRAAGFAYNAASDVLKELDTFCLQNDFSEATVTKELADAWSIQRESEGISARNIRVGILRQVSKYIISLGIDAYLPSHDQSTETKEAHVFTEEERIAFFEKLNSLAPVRRAYGERLLRECRVLFRLYYCCGMRLAEPLEMTWECFDPDAMTLRILHSKGDKDRIIWILEDMVSMLNSYRDYIRKTCPDSEWMFPGIKNGKHLNEVTVRDYFLRVWNSTEFSENSNPPTIKSFRHTFVVDRLNLWMSGGTDAEERLPYLSKHLGHNRIDESLYYYHQVEESRKIIRLKDTTSGRVIPEVNDNEE